MTLLPLGVGLGKPWLIQIAMGSGHFPIEKTKKFIGIDCRRRYSMLQRWLACLRLSDMAEFYARITKRDGLEFQTVSLLLTDLLANLVPGRHKRIVMTGSFLSRRSRRLVTGNELARNLPIHVAFCFDFIVFGHFVLLVCFDF